mmetsp:Transcript_41023/g.74325  ORF Transcript_41023/g.74325 Transcript_41023/m.74325 type:complete len:177 (-) Transcript_41023:175-705(-)
MAPNQVEEGFEASKMQVRKSRIVLDGSCLCAGSCCCLNSNNRSNNKASEVPKRRSSFKWSPARTAANAKAAANKASSFVTMAASKSFSTLTPLISSVAAVMLSPEHEGTFCPEGHCAKGGTEGGNAGRSGLPRRQQPLQTEGGNAGNGGVSAFGAGEGRKKEKKRTVTFFRQQEAS